MIGGERSRGENDSWYFHMNASDKGHVLKFAATSGLRMAAAASLATAQSSFASDWVRFGDDGNSISVSAEAFTVLRGMAAVHFRIGETNHVLRPRDMNQVASPVRGTEQTPFGDAYVLRMTYASEGERFLLSVNLRRLDDLHAFTLQAIFHNRSAEHVNLAQFDLFDTREANNGQLRVEDPDAWLVTPLMDDKDVFSLADAGRELREAAMLYHRDRGGFLVGPVGPAEAFTAIKVGDGSLVAQVAMDGVLVRPGESRRSEEMIFCFQSPESATVTWTRLVAATHGAHRDRPAVHGWCSWYDRTTKIDEAHIRLIMDTVAAHPETFGHGVLQIDDGYQKMDGDWSANERFPSGMAQLAQDIRRIGWTPGVWFAPLMIHPDHPWAKANPDALQTNADGIAKFMNANAFHPDGAKWLNPDHPKSREFLRNIIAGARENGYGYMKIDFNGIGAQFIDPTKTRLQVFRELYALYREAAGEDTYLLACLGAPHRGVIGYADAARIGPDSHPAHFVKCLKSVLRFQIFNGVWWRNDPDVTYLAPNLPSRKFDPVPENEEKWRTWHTVNALVGGTAMVSEPLNAPDCHALWRRYEMMRPSSAVPARLLNIGKSGRPSVFGFTVHDSNGLFGVYTLYNDGSSNASVAINFHDAGLPQDVSCAVFDFWEGRVVGYATNRYEAGSLPPYGSRLLRFTPVDSEGPILVGSDLHLSVGATEVRAVVTEENRTVTTLAGAGAREGVLTYFSRRSLAVSDTTNCTIDGVEQEGEHLWKVRISSRQLDKEQSFTLVAGDS